MAENSPAILWLTLQPTNCIIFMECDFCLIQLPQIPVCVYIYFESSAFVGVHTQAHNCEFEGAISEPFVLLHHDGS